MLTISDLYCIIYMSASQQQFERTGDVMDVNEIITMISTVGFPIVACVALYLQSREQNKSISELSLSLQKLSDKIEQLIDCGKEG